MVKNLKKTQISIYIIIAVIILFLLILLIYFSTEEKITNLDYGKNKLEQNTEESLLVKNRIDFCLSNSLKKALIVSGLKGGYIYNRNEYMFGGIIPQNSYKIQMISNYNLNWNKLQSETLVYSSQIPTIPEISENSLILEGKNVFSHTMTQDYQRFINSEFMRCLNFDDLNESYEFNYTDYYGKVRAIDYLGNQLFVGEMDADIGDLILIDIEKRDIIGKVESKTTDNQYIVKFNNLYLLQDESITTFEDLNVINLNKSLNLTIKFNYEDVSANLNYPIIIKNGDSLSSFKDTTVVVPVRIRALIEFAKEMINTKYYEEKDIEYSNPQKVYEALNKSEYFKTTPYKNFVINKKIIKNEKEIKQYVYSIVDKNSIINGNPFVLNFGYENIAPIIEFNSTIPNMKTGNETTVLFTSKDYLTTYDLREHTKEKQLFDQFKFYFEEQEYFSTDADFKITKEGIMTFMPKREKFYTYTIRVTDGETIRDHTIFFITGFPENKNNSEANRCIKLEVTTDLNRLFPINHQLKNKVFSYEKNGYHNLIGLRPYYPAGVINSPNKIGNNYLTFSKKCVYNEDLFTIKAYKLDSSGNKVPITYTENGDDYKILLPDVTTNVDKYQFDVISSDGTVMTEPFRVDVYPASCMGPSEDETFLDKSCCDVNAILSKIDNVVETGNDAGLSFLGTDILKNNELLIDEEVYLCYDVRAKTSSILSTINPSENVIWNIFDNEITSLYESSIKIKCEGKYPLPEQNIVEIKPSSGGSNYGKLTGISIQSIYDNNIKPIDVFLKKSVNAGKCQFCDLESESMKIVLNYKNLNKNAVFSIGLKSENPTPIVDFIPDNGNYTDVFILCDNKLYGTQNPVSKIWTDITSQSFYGKDSISPTTFYISRGYCDLGSTNCLGRTNSPGSDSKSDLVGTCRDYYYQVPTKTSGFQLNTGWVCGTSKVCQSGVCT